jgi:dTDP-4-amino-4,6-dideoxygalactose transaminase
MDGIQGAVLRVKLRRLEESNEGRRRNARHYEELLGGGKGQGIGLPSEAPHNRHVYHVYAVRVGERDRVLKGMGEKGIGCAIHYPVPVHLQEAYRWLGYGEGSFPVAERCAREFLSLPMYPELRGEQVEAVAAGLKGCVGAGSAVGCAA